MITILSDLCHTFSIFCSLHGKKKPTLLIFLLHFTNSFLGEQYNKYHAFKIGKDTAAVPPSRTKMNKQSQGLHLYGRFIQMASDMRGCGVHALTDHLTFSFQTFITEKEVH